MDENKKIAVKNFLRAVKGAVMAMDIDSLKEDQIAAVYNGFVEMYDAITEDSSSAS